MTDQQVSDINGARSWAETAMREAVDGPPKLSASIERAERWRFIALKLADKLLGDDGILADFARMESAVAAPSTPKFVKFEEENDG